MKQIPEWIIPVCKSRTPKGDGNFGMVFNVSSVIIVWKSRTPKGDGNVQQQAHLQFP